MGRCSRELPPAQGVPRGSPPKGRTGNKPVVLEGAAAGVGVVVFGPRASRRTVGRGTRMCRGSVDTAEPSSSPPRDRDRQGQSWTGRRGAVDGKGIPGWQQRDFSRGSPQRPRLTGSTRDLLSLRRAVDSRADAGGRHRHRRWGSSGSPRSDGVSEVRSKEVWRKTTPSGRSRARRSQRGA
jgi:hypothetical protein